MVTIQTLQTIVNLPLSCKKNAENINIATNFVWFFDKMRIFSIMKIVVWSLFYFLRFIMKIAGFFWPFFDKISFFTIFLTEKEFFHNLFMKFIFYHLLMKIAFFLRSFDKNNIYSRSFDKNWNFLQSFEKTIIALFFYSLLRKTAVLQDLLSKTALFYDLLTKIMGGGWFFDENLVISVTLWRCKKSKKQKITDL